MKAVILFGALFLLWALRHQESSEWKTVRRVQR